MTRSKALFLAILLLAVGVILAVFPWGPDTPDGDDPPDGPATSTPHTAPAPATDAATAEANVELTQQDRTFFTKIGYAWTF